jgi:hypothetical protein
MTRKAPRASKVSTEQDAATARTAASDGKPRWDAETCQLHWRGKVVKRYRRRAELQWTILAAFEEERWREQIDDPLPGNGGAAAKERLRETVESMRRSLRGTGLRFGVAGCGTRVR